jgi:ABC-2 type transport system permease protein
VSNWRTIARREFSACFLSPVAYVTLVVFLTVVNGTFFVAVLRNLGSYEPLATLLFTALCVWLPMLITVVTMRLFAEEKRSGTIETLMTAPVTETEVVWGKYAGALGFTLLVSAPAVASVFLLERLSPGITLVDLDVGALLAGCLIATLLIACLTALGLLISLFTRNQIVSALACLSAICVALLSGWLLSLVPGADRHAVEYLSATTHIEDFARGMVSAGPAVLYVSLTLFLLFTAARILELRPWK